MDAILVALGLSLIRAFYPLEYWNSFLIRVPIVLTTIFRVLEYPILTLTLGYTIETYHVLGMIWIIGSIYYLFKFAKINRDIIRLLKLIEKKYGFYKTDSRKKLLEDLKCRIVKSEKISEPFSIRFFGYNRIFLPDIDFTDKELEFVLDHEINHIKRRDNYKKIFVQFVKTVFWWNPVINIFSRNFNHLLEVQTDLTTTEVYSKEDKINYVWSIQNLIKKIKINNLDNKQDYLLTGMFSLGNVESIAQRYTLVLDYKIRKLNIKKIILFASLILVYFSTYFVTIQPAYEPKGEGIYSLKEDPETSYILEDKEKDEYIIVMNHRPYEVLKKDDPKLESEKYKNLNIYELNRSEEF